MLIFFIKSIIFLLVKRMTDWLIELWFYVSLDTKQVILETFFSANLLN